MTTIQSQLNSLRHKQRLLYLLLFSVATVLIWVVFSLLTSQRNPGVSPEQQKLAKQFNPNLDVSVIDRIEQKKSYQPADLNTFPIYKIVKSKDGKTEQIVTTDLDNSVVEALLATDPITTTSTPIPSTTPSNNLQTATNSAQLTTPDAI